MWPALLAAMWMVAPDSFFPYTTPFRAWIEPLPIQVSVPALVSTPLRLFVLAPLREALPARVVVPLPARSPPVHVNGPLGVKGPRADGCTAPLEIVVSPETISKPLGTRL